MKRHRISIWHAIMATAIIIALVNTGVMQITQMTYQRFLVDYSEEYQWLMRIVDLREGIHTLYDTASAFMSASKASWPALAEHYEARLAAVQGSLDEMRTSLTGDARHQAQDLYNMVLTFDEHYREYNGALQTSYSVYLRADLQYLRRLVTYFEDELSTEADILTLSAKSAYDSYVARLARLRLGNAMLTAVAIIAGLAVAIWMGRSIARPIDALAKRMRHHSDSDADADWTPGTSAIAEINALENSYRALIAQSAEHQRMERELSQQKLENEQTRNLLKSAELDMLRMQMNPHFLFNTLNSISALGEMENAPRVSEMVQQLSEMLRYSMSDNTTDTPLQEALVIVDDYVGILRMRFGDRLEYHCDIEDAALIRPVPRMVLQPLVENSVQHGFPHIQAGSRIDIDARLAEDELVIHVRDNGVGMSPERLKSVMEDREAEHGIGLRNVIMRMELLYGRGCVIVESVEGQGTCVTLRIPGTPIRGMKAEDAPFSEDGSQKTERKL